MPSAFNRALFNDKSPQLGANLDLNGFGIDFPTTSNITDVISSTSLTGAANTNLATALAVKTYVDNGLSAKQDTITDGNGLAFTGSTLNVDLSATPFLEFSTGQLQAIVLDEDNMASDSATSLATQQSIKAYADTKIAATEKGAANGVASLDGGGKVPVSQLPSAVMTYEGVWNASTNTPTLADGVGDAGQVYRVSVAGTIDLGSGSVVYNVGDYVIYNGTIWEKSDTTDAVASVNGQTGIVVLDTDDISEATNLYYTEARVSANTDVAANTAARHAALTLNADAPTQESANLVGQELQLVQATTTTDGVMSSEDKLKLDGIEAGATADQTAGEIKSLYESNPDTNAFTDAEQSKLAGIEAGATADQIASEVPVTPTGNLSSSDVQAALQELQGDIDTINSTITDTNSESIAQTAHGLSVGNLVKVTANDTFAKAQADSAANAEVIGIVISVADANNFTIAYAGYHTLTGATLTAGLVYYLDPSVSGGYTAIVPTTTGQVDKPCFRAINATKIAFAPERGIVLD